MLIAGGLFRRGGDSIAHVMYQHLQAYPPTFASLGLSITPEIESVIRKALAKDKDQRFATVEEFLSEYENALLKLNKPIASKPSNKATPSLLHAETLAVEDQLSTTENYTSEDFDKTYKLSSM